MDLTKLTIKEAHNGLKDKNFSCVDLVQACLSQIEEHDDQIKAFVTVTAESALKEAKKVDEKIANNEEIQLLEGIPYSVKDAILITDVKGTCSSNMLKEFISPYNATVIDRLNAAGAIMIGKTNCDAYGHGSSTENSDFFVTKNPWDESKIAGGSSGGSAASVAMGMCLFSIGEDTGGSIRQPAAMCGITGLKVSYGRVPRYGSIAYASSLDTIGPFARSVEDCASVLQVIAGVDPKDHTTVPQEVPDYVKKFGEVENLKIGIPKEYFTNALDPKIKEVVMSAVETLKEHGAEIKEISLPYTKHCIATYYLIAPAETSSNLSRLDGIRYGHRTSELETLTDLYKNTRAEGFGAENKRRIMMGTYALSAGYYDAYYKKAQQVRTLIIQDYERAFEEVDIILSPTSPITAFGIGEKKDPLAMYLADIYTIGFSLAGLPTISVPCGFVDNLPVGMQLSGPSFKEDLVLKIADAYQRVTDWHLKSPVSKNK